MANDFNPKVAAARSLERKSATASPPEETLAEFKKRAIDVPFNWPITEMKVKGTTENASLNALYRAIRNLSVRGGDTLTLNVIANFSADVSVDLRSLLVLIEKKDLVAAEQKLRAILTVDAGPWLSPEQHAFYEEAFRRQMEEQKDAEAKKAAAEAKAREFGRASTKPGSGHSQ